MSEKTISSMGWKVAEKTENISAAAHEIKSDKAERRTAERSSQAAAKPTPMASAFAMTSVQFKVDGETNDVVILIKDKKSDQILRTIPADAIKDLPPGQIMDVYY